MNKRAVSPASLSAAERRLRSRLHQLLSSSEGSLHGSLIVMARRCGKPSCRCATDDNARHPDLCLGQTQPRCASSTPMKPLPAENRSPALPSRRPSARTGIGRRPCPPRSLRPRSSSSSATTAGGSRTKGSMNWSPTGTPATPSTITPTQCWCFGLCCSAPTRSTTAFCEICSPPCAKAHTAIYFATLITAELLADIWHPARPP